MGSSMSSSSSYSFESSGYSSGYSGYDFNSDAYAFRSSGHPFGSAYPCGDGGDNGWTGSSGHRTSGRSPFSSAPPFSRDPFSFDSPFSRDPFFSSHRMGASGLGPNLDDEISAPTASDGSRRSRRDLFDTESLTSSLFPAAIPLNSSLLNRPELAPLREACANVADDLRERARRRSTIDADAVGRTSTLSPSQRLLGEDIDERMKKALASLTGTISPAAAASERATSPSRIKSAIVALPVLNDTILPTTDIKFSPRVDTGQESKEGFKDEDAELPSGECLLGGAPSSIIELSNDSSKRSWSPPIEVSTDIGILPKAVIMNPHSREVEVMNMTAFAKAGCGSLSASVAQDVTLLPKLNAYVTETLHAEAAWKTQNVGVEIGTNWVGRDGMAYIKGWNPDKYSFQVSKKVEVGPPPGHWVPSDTDLRVQLRKGNMVLDLCTRISDEYVDGFIEARNNSFLASQGTFYRSDTGLLFGDTTITGTFNSGRNNVNFKSKNINLSGVRRTDLVLSDSFLVSPLNKALGLDMLKVVGQAAILHANEELFALDLAIGFEAAKAWNSRSKTSLSGAHNITAGTVSFAGKHVQRVHKHVDVTVKAEVVSNDSRKSKLSVLIQPVGLQGK